ncbi:MAG: LysR family transcriptional regulator [Hamadaea sp.]|uniref:LysR family transcriptional regulator n=1 Tax=Hamadaea sp. TaxID=2024425 RepID=UPI0017A88E71|nr:LysR family transcriptional regulator [Hamadaea sp.]NUR71545.1 LysR family transcriptional regulator [Hamadaea sp.]NUT19655.1 LysR family transcriptional regulator [Hamadaea sp.]
MPADPTLRDIRCFTVVARRAGFSAAAAELGISQPAVSQAIARLESTLGVTLLTRAGTVTLTEAGRALLARAEAVLEQADLLVADAARLATPEADAIRFAYAPLVGGLAAKIARRLRDRKPGVPVTLVPAHWEPATTALTGGSVAVALMTTPFPAGLASAARFRMPVTHVAVRAGERLATASAIRIEQLFGSEMLIPRMLWSAMLAAFPGVHQPRVTVVDDDLYAGCDLVAAGRGVLPVPRLLAETVRRPDVVFVPFDTRLHLAYALVWNPARVSPELVALIQATQEALRTFLA